MASADEAPDWLWTAPDLSSGGEWHQARVANLKVAVHGLPDATEQLARGLAALDVHRLNYAEAGSIHRLQLLWWEFPPRTLGGTSEWLRYEFLDGADHRGDGQLTDDGGTSGDCGGVHR